jgi:hypothetical protein
MDESYYIEDIPVFCVYYQYNTQNYWVFGLCPSSHVQKTIEQVLETGFVAVLSLGGYF